MKIKQNITILAGAIALVACNGSGGTPANVGGTSVNATQALSYQLATGSIVSTSARQINVAANGLTTVAVNLSGYTPGDKVTIAAQSALPVTIGNGGTNVTLVAGNPTNSAAIIHVAGGNVAAGNYPVKLFAISNANNSSTVQTSKYIGQVMVTVTPTGLASAIQASLSAPQAINLPAVGNSQVMTIALNGNSAAKNITITAVDPTIVSASITNCSLGGDNRLCEVIVKGLKHGNTQIKVASADGNLTTTTQVMVDTQNLAVPGVISLNRQSTRVLKDGSRKITVSLDGSVNSDVAVKLAVANNDVAKLSTDECDFTPTNKTCVVTVTGEKANSHTTITASAENYDTNAIALDVGGVSDNLIVGNEQGYVYTTNMNSGPSSLIQNDGSAPINTLDGSDIVQIMPIYAVPSGDTAETKIGTVALTKSGNLWYMLNNPNSQVWEELPNIPYQETDAAYSPSNNIITCITADGSGNIYAGTSLGDVWKISPDVHEQYADQSWTNYVSYQTLNDSAAPITALGMTNNNQAPDANNTTLFIGTAASGSGRSATNGSIYFYENGQLYQLGSPTTTAQEQLNITGIQVVETGKGSGIYGPNKDFNALVVTTSSITGNMNEIWNYTGNQWGAWAQVTNISAGNTQPNTCPSSISAFTLYNDGELWASCGGDVFYSMNSAAHEAFTGPVNNKSLGLGVTALSLAITPGGYDLLYANTQDNNTDNVTSSTGYIPLNSTSTIDAYPVTFANNSNELTTAAYFDVGSFKANLGSAPVLEGFSNAAALDQPGRPALSDAESAGSVTIGGYSLDGHPLVASRVYPGSNNNEQLWLASAAGMYASTQSATSGSSATTPVFNYALNNSQVVGGAKSVAMQLESNVPNSGLPNASYYNVMSINADVNNAQNNLITDWSAELETPSTGSNGTFPPQASLPNSVLNTTTLSLVGHGQIIGLGSFDLNGNDLTTYGGGFYAYTQNGTVALIDEGLTKSQGQCVNTNPLGYYPYYQMVPCTSYQLGQMSMSGAIQIKDMTKPTAAILSGDNNHDIFVADNSATNVPTVSLVNVTNGASIAPEEPSIFSTNKAPALNGYYIVAEAMDDSGNLYAVVNQLVNGTAGIQDAYGVYELTNPGSLSQSNVWTQIGDPQKDITQQAGLAPWEYITAMTVGASGQIYLGTSLGHVVVNNGNDNNWNILTMANSGPAVLNGAPITSLATY